MVKEDSNELTADEKKAFLDSRIRRGVRWNIPAKDVPSFHENNDAAIQRVAQKIFDDIVSDYQYNTSVLKATRAVKFNVDYVAKVVRAGLADGTVSLNEAAAKELDSLTEGMLSADDLEQRIHGITCLVARESLQK
jgi:hypothetical protein